MRSLRRPRPARADAVSAPPTTGRPSQLQPLGPVGPTASVASGARSVGSARSGTAAAGDRPRPTRRHRQPARRRRQRRRRGADDLAARGPSASTAERRQRGASVTSTNDDGDRSTGSSGEARRDERAILAARSRVLVAHAPPGAASAMTRERQAGTLAAGNCERGRRPSRRSASRLDLALVGGVALAGVRRLPAHALARRPRRRRGRAPVRPADPRPDPPDRLSAAGAAALRLELTCRSASSPTA